MIITPALRSPTLAPISSPTLTFLGKVVEVAEDIFDQVHTLLASYQLNFTVLRYAFYGIRIPFIYLEYFVHEMIHDTALAIIGNVLYLCAELGHLAKWFQFHNLLELGWLSNALGKVSFLSGLAHCPIDAGLSIISGVASVFYAIDYSIKLAKGNLPRQEKIAVWLGLTASIVHIVAIAIFCGSGSALFPVTLGLTGVSVVFYVMYWFLHRYPLKCLS